MTTTATRRLAAAQLEVVSDARARAHLRAALVAVLAALAGAAALHVAVNGANAVAERGRLQQDNSGLRAEIARLEAELQLERATHAALDHQVAELNGQVAELERQRAFIDAQRARPRHRTETGGAP